MTAVLKLEATLTQNRFKEPLAVIERGLGEGMECAPSKLRAIAATLLKIADDAESRPMEPRTFRATRKEYEVIPAA